MVARQAYEYFLKEIGGSYLNKEDGNKMTLQACRHLIFEKNNCTIEQDSFGDLLLTLIDSDNSNISTTVSESLQSLKNRGMNQVLWWGQRGVSLKVKNQYSR